MGQGMRELSTVRGVAGFRERLMGNEMTEYYKIKCVGEGDGEGKDMK